MLQGRLFERCVSGLLLMIKNINELKEFCVLLVVNLNKTFASIILQRIAKDRQHNHSGKIPMNHFVRKVYEGYCLYFLEKQQTNCKTLLLLMQNFPLMFLKV